MAITGDLKNLHIADVIQLLHTTRKSGTFSVKGDKGISRMIFSNGYIVGANHLNNRVRVGTVLINMKAISSEDLDQALEVQNNAGKDRKPLLVTLIELGKIEQQEAFKWLKKLIEITIVDMISWTEGAFMFDEEAISVSAECSYIPGEMEQEMSLDAQMVLMDTLRIFDERERDRSAGKDIPSDVEVYGEETAPEEPQESAISGSEITADALGLADVDQLERKIHKPFTAKELFDPLEIHRQQIRSMLPDFSTEEQETFVSFLGKATAGARTHLGAIKQEGQARALLLFSKDAFIKHTFMTIYKNEGVLIFASDTEEELDSFIDQSLSKNILPIMVFDSPEKSEGGFSEEKITELRRKVKQAYPKIGQVQLAFPLDYTFMLQSYNDGVKAVLPKPLKDARKSTFIKDTIDFLEAFKSYIKDYFQEQKGPSTTDDKSDK